MVTEASGVLSASLRSPSGTPTTRADERGGGFDGEAREVQAADGGVTGVGHGMRGGSGSSVVPGGTGSELTVRAVLTVGVGAGRWMCASSGARVMRTVAAWPARMAKHTPTGRRRTSLGSTLNACCRRAL